MDLLNDGIQLDSDENEWNENEMEEKRSVEKRESSEDVENYWDSLKWLFKNQPETGTQKVK